MHLTKNLILIFVSICSVSTLSYSSEKKPTQNAVQPQKEVAKWVDVEFGITEQELEKIRPDVQNSKSPRTIKSHYSSQEIPSYLAAGLDFNVLFFFDNQTKRLDEIALRVKNVQDNVDLICNNLSASLAEKYGPTLHKHKTGTYTVLTTTQWTTSLLTIQLLCSVGDSNNVLIKYMPKDKNTAGL